MAREGDPAMSTSKRRLVALGSVLLVVGLAAAARAALQQSRVASSQASYDDAVRRAKDSADPGDRSQALGESVSSARFVQWYELERNVYSAGAAGSLLLSVVLFARATRK
jgi:hypothetical protein